MKLTQTTTQVHSRPSQLHQRWEAYVSDQYKLSALSLLAQLFLSHSLFLMDRVSTPSYLSILLFLLPFMLLHGLSVLLSRHTRSPHSLLTALLPPWLGRILEGLIGLSLLLDAIFLLCGASSLLGEILPTLRRYTIAPLLGLFGLLTLLGNKPYALTRLSGFLFIPLLAGIALSSAPALPEGNAHHLFPLLGKGPASILTGALWLCGSAGGACLPLLMPGEEGTMERMRQKGKHRGSLFLLLCVFFGLLIAALYAYLMPPYAMAEKLPMGARLLLPVQVSSSVPGWSVYVCSLILLLLLSYTGAVSRCSTFLFGSCTESRHAPNWLLVLVTLLSLPFAVFYSHKLQSLLINLLPYRVVPYLLAILCASIGAVYQQTKRRLGD